MTRKEAYSFLAGLRRGDAVRVTADGKTHEMTVQRELMRGDGGGFGSWDYANVSVGWGPGRYNREVHAVGIEKGLYTVERSEG